MNTLQSGIVASHDWDSAQRSYEVSAPYNYAVIDNFLEPDACKYLHQKILEHWGWRYKDWISQHLHNSRLDIPEIFSIRETLEVCCPKLFQERELIAHWALMYPNNTPGRIHSDRTGINLNLWLTPDEYNLEPSRGGLVFFDVKADTKEISEMSAEQLSSPSWSEEFVNKRTKGDKVIISYKCNRAILFDASTFHQTDVLNFVKVGAKSHRINLSLAFDKPAKKEAIKLK